MSKGTSGSQVNQSVLESASQQSLPLQGAWQVPGKPRQPVSAPAPPARLASPFPGLVSSLLPCAKTSQESSLGCRNPGERVASSLGGKSPAVRAGMWILGQWGGGCRPPPSCGGFRGRSPVSTDLLSPSPRQFEGDA